MTLTTGLRRPDVVCIVASTGGPNALTHFLTTFSAAPEVPFVIVQHMPEGFTGRLAERLTSVGSFTVREAGDGDALEPGVALVAPGGAHLRFEGERVRLSDALPVGGLRPRGDLTLHDLAASHGAGMLAVVLTGMGDDGLAGAQAVVDVGGQVVAQDAATTAVDGMPRRVREAGLATLIADPIELAEAVAKACGLHAVGRRATDPAVLLPEPTAPNEDGARLSRELLAEVRSLLAETEGADLHQLRDSYVARRVASFARRHHLAIDEQLLSSLAVDPSLRRELLGRLHVHVTSFFRDYSHWEDLDDRVIGTLPAAPRIWSAGCADGSEAYSLALLCLERGRRPDVWATDVDEPILSRVATGRYREDDLRDVPDDLRRRYFRAPPSGGVEVRADLRRAVHTDRHDALHDPMPPERFDLVACRNLVIYLGADGRERLYQRLSDAVRPGGVLFTGAADSFHDPGRFGFTHLGRTLFRRDAA